MIAETGSAEAFQVFVEALRSTDEKLWSWAARGLHRLNTPEARRALWEARAAQRRGPDETARFHKVLDDVSTWK